MSTYKRLFTFGCSFTSYTWKTWADILGQQAEEFYNFGQIGGGNEQIFFKIIEANKKYKFTKNDTVAVCWTYYYRKDIYQINKWKPISRTLKEEWNLGSWFKNQNINPDEQYLKTLSFISACNLMLPSLCNYLSFSTIDYSEKSNPSKNVPWESNLQKIFQQESTQFDNKNYEDVFQISSDLDCERRISADLRPHDDATGHPDDHPTPLEHAYFVENVLGIHIDEQTKAKIHEWEKEIATT
ncbi:MAG: hypothetical protein VYA01_04430 [Bacteroidota bacterium]|nr:hypothetical protein [Bacteroidota bacterium]|tara:strand:+ start:292 stop:1014 length:723 start_codon:yes stop_codon:yes gene_type:complete